MAASWFLSPLGEYGSSYIETLGAILGTFLAITGALWTQRKIDEVQDKKELRESALIVYYDFEFEFSFSEKELIAVEEEMKRIVKESLSLQVYKVSKKEAQAYMQERQEDYKVELIQSLPEQEKISFYKQGEYMEFCSGPHISNTCQVKVIKLLSISGSYWKGDEKGKRLTRIYGISFPKASQMEEYIDRLR